MAPVFPPPLPQLFNRECVTLASYTVQYHARGRLQFREDFFLFTFIFYVCFPCLYACAPHACNASTGQKRASDLPELELQVVMSCQVNPGNWIRVLWKSSGCSYSLRQLSSATQRLFSESQAFLTTSYSVFPPTTEFSGAVLLLQCFWNSLAWASAPNLALCLFL